MIVSCAVVPSCQSPRHIRHWNCAIPMSFSMVILKDSCYWRVTLGGRMDWISVQATFGLVRRPAIPVRIIKRRLMSLGLRMDTPSRFAVPMLRISFRLVVVLPMRLQPTSSTLFMRDRVVHGKTRSWAQRSGLTEARSRLRFQSGMGPAELDDVSMNHTGSSLTILFAGCGRHRPLSRVIADPWTYAGAELRIRLLR